MKAEHLAEMLEARPLLRRKDLAQRFGWCLRTVDNYHQRGVLPRAIYLPGCPFPFWRPVDLDRWERKQTRRKG